MMAGCWKHDHAIPVLKGLHLFPVSERTQFKTPVLTFKSLNSQALTYLAELIREKVNTRTLRSSSELILTVPKKY